MEESFPDYTVSVKRHSERDAWTVALCEGDCDISMLFDTNTLTPNHYTHKTVGTLLLAFEEKVDIIKAIVNAGRSVRSLHSFMFSTYNPGFTEEEESFEFAFLNKDSDLIHLYYYPENQSVQEFIELLSYFDNSVFEGEVINTYSEFGDFQDTLVDGFPLRFLHMLGERVKIEILRDEEDE